ncbi:MAG TPA: MarR family transcriptional regulator [Jatrophihabitantaceae bacterium]|nr:MarR family transcriptional regulator [Jatrophihabitantaceae bacterium]
MQTSIPRPAVPDPLTLDPPALDPLALERQVCFALAIASRSVLAVYRPLLEPMGLTHPQYLVMLALWGRSPLSVKDLGAMLQLDSPTLSPLLKRLEAAGFLTRTRSRNDERQLAIELTERGRALRTDAERIPPTIVSRLGIEVSALESLHAALTSLIAAARAAGAVGAVGAVGRPEDPRTSEPVEAS